MENDDAPRRRKRNPRRDSDQLPVAEVGRTCGQCVYWKADKENEDMGECYLNPPAVLILEESPIVIRPTLERDERACSHFRGCQ